MNQFDLDILTSTGFSDALWSLKNYTPQSYKYSIKRTPEEIKCEVLESRRVRHIIEETAKERNEAISKVKDEAKGILDEMGHNFSLKTIRLMAFMLKKILTTLFRKVLVNKEGLDKLKKASVHNPIVLVPSHRSYMDFLLVSFICFSADLPLPFVAAAQDFLNMKVVRRLFRKSGAFFMRRSFMTDKLYWVIFTEYVQNQLQRGDKPLEFFLEGTRSRTGKFLHPRLGLLSMVVDLYANAGVPNILLCPISMTYERVLEEPLFAYELLGIPKPKESLRGLIKSRSVLSEDYGSIYVNFGELIPLSSCIEGKLDRMATACIPRHLLFYLTNEEKEVVRQLGYQITAKLQSRMVVTPSVIVAAIMLQNQQGLFIDDVVHRFVWLQQLFRKLNISLAPSDVKDPRLVVKESFVFQKASLEVDPDGFVRIREPDISPKDLHTSSAAAHASKQQHHVISSVKDVLDEAAIQLQLAYKRNTLLPYFFGIGVVSLCALKQKSDDKDLGMLSDDFDFLSRLLVKEVAGLAESLNQVFKRTVEIMQDAGIITCDQINCVTISQGSCIEFASGLWIPILTAYWMVCEYLIRNVGSSSEKSVSDIPKGAQHLAAEYVLSGTVRFYEVLSLELMRNALQTFIDLQVVKTNRRHAGAVLISVPDKSSLRRIHQKIGDFLDIESDTSYLSTPASKL